MSKHLLTAVAAIALMSGVASAQTYPPAPPPPGTTVMPVVPPAPLPGSSVTTTTVAPSTEDHRAVTIHKEVDENGNTVTKKDTYREGVAGSTQTHTKTETDPDGGTTTTRSKTTTKQE
jgi:hypothetical protein